MCVCGLRVFDNEVSSVSRESAASGPSRIVDESSYGSGKRRRREAARRGNRRAARSGAELELGVMVLVEVEWRNARLGDSTCACWCKTCRVYLLVVFGLSNNKQSEGLECLSWKCAT